MPAGRFVVPADLLVAGAAFDLPAEVAHQARDVLRLVPGDALTLLDGAGGEWPATLTEVSRARVRVAVAERQASAAEPRTRLVLCQGMLKAAKLEWVLQKGTELGVAAFVPLLCERAVSGVEEMGAAKRARWQRILFEATEQCGRARVPDLREPRPLSHALADLPARAIALMPWEEEHATSLRFALASALHGSLPNAAKGSSASEQELRTGNPPSHEFRLAPGDAAAAPRDIYLFVGPEGGFSSGEVALARRHGAIPLTLGPRILRAETAAVVAAALALELCGDLG
jgi:16S rRNA (uracil1498-N3)-methyltransferase